MSSCCAPAPQADPTPTDANAIRARVRAEYGQIAETVGSSCCGPSSCGPSGVASLDDRARSLGYTDAQLAAVPLGANLGLGCGNPTAIASLRPGETVLDLGSGAGFDALLAAEQVGAEGRVIGVDTTPQMLARARKNAVEADLAGICDFREGLIEALPVVDDSVDVILSNCVINLSPDKPQVFREAFRVLRPGGRIAVSDIVLTEELPALIAGSASSWVACLSGAMLADDYLQAIRDAGFTDIDFTRTPAADLLEGALTDPTFQAVVAAAGEQVVRDAAGRVWSYKITASKPLVTAES